MPNWTIDLSDVIPPEPVSQDRIESVENRIFQLLNNLTQMQSRFSAHPVLNDDATFFQRLSHKIKVGDYAKISVHERSISETQRATAENILAVLNEAGMFLKRVEDQNQELFHKERMREVEYQKGVQEVERIKAEVGKLKADTESILAQAARMRAEAAKVENPDRRAERTVTINRD